MVKLRSIPFLMFLCTSTSCVQTLSFSQRDYALERQLQRVPIVKIVAKEVSQGEAQEYALMTGSPYQEGILGVHHHDNFSEIQVDGQPVKVLARSRGDDFYDDWMLLERPASYSAAPIPGGDPPKVGTPIWVVGYPQERLRSLPDTRKRAVIRGHILDCKNCPVDAIFVLPDSPARDKDHLYGFSGSPALYLDDSGRLRVFGVIIAFRVQHVTMKLYGIPFMGRYGVPLTYSKKTLLIIRRIPNATELRDAAVIRQEGE